MYEWRGMGIVTIHPRGLAFVAIAMSILFAIDRFDIDWRVGLFAISIDAVAAFVPFFAGPGNTAHHELHR